MPSLRLLLVFLFSLGVCHAASARETITLVADEWCPYNCGEEDVKPGYMVEVAREALAKYDIDVVYKVMPWEQAIAKVRTGAYEALVGANRGDAPDFIYPEMIQGISVSQAWVREDSAWQYTDPQSLADRRIAVVASYAYGRILDPHLKTLLKTKPGQMVVSATSDATARNIALLMAGNVDVVFEDRNVVEYYFASRGLPMGLKSAGNSVGAQDYEDTYIFVAFSPKKKESPRYAELLVAGIREMEKNGELEAILMRYHMDRNYRFPAENTQKN